MPASGLIGVEGTHKGYFLAPRPPFRVPPLPDRRCKPHHALARVPQVPTSAGLSTPKLRNPVRNSRFLAFLSQERASGIRSVQRVSGFRFRGSGVAVSGGCGTFQDVSARVSPDLGDPKRGQRWQAGAGGIRTFRGWHGVVLSRDVSVGWAVNDRANLLETGRRGKR